MIRKIKIENYKSLFRSEVCLSNLNVFTGVNASGKSTLLQTLLLLRQSFNNGNFYKKNPSVSLSNPNNLVNVGTFKDILCYSAEKEKEQIKFEVEFDSCLFSFTSNMYNLENKDFNSIEGKLGDSVSKLEEEALFTDRFQYLGAERIEPNEDYPRFNESNLFLGKKGEFTPHYLNKFGNSNLSIDALCLSSSAVNKSLVYQLNEWLGQISKSVEVHTNENLSTNKIELSYRYKLNDGTPTAFQKPQNVGFGLTHTLPIMVAILAAKPNDIIIIENPETHLHPKGQTKLTNLISIAAQNGVQFFIETHSDHIINGLRVALKNRVIQKEKVALFYFTKNNISLSEIQKINVQDDGGLDSWPDGFFDEFDNSLNQLL